MNDFSLEIIELEFKYKADNVKLSDFTNFAKLQSPHDTLEVGSWDIYYGDNTYGLPFDFLRHRLGTEPELTLKIKSKESNNNDRVEVDLKLKSMPAWIIAKFCQLLGFSERFRIYKDCNVFWYKNISLVYYIVYDINKEEQGRFIEIECTKDATAFTSKEQAMEELVAFEKTLSVFGITAANRLRKSIWETFK